MSERGPGEVCKRVRARMRSMELLALLFCCLRAASTPLMLHAYDVADTKARIYPHMLFRLMLIESDPVRERSVSVRARAWLVFPMHSVLIRGGEDAGLMLARERNAHGGFRSCVTPSAPLSCLCMILPTLVPEYTTSYIHSGLDRERASEGEFCKRTRACMCVCGVVCPCALY